MPPQTFNSETMVAQSPIDRNATSKGVGRRWKFSLREIVGLHILYASILTCVAIVGFNSPTGVLNSPLAETIAINPVIIFGFTTLLGATLGLLRAGFGGAVRWGLVCTFVAAFLYFPFLYRLVELIN